MQYCLPKSFLGTSGQEAASFLPSVWMGIQFRFRQTCLPEDGIAVLHVKLQEGTESIHVLRKTTAQHPLL